MSWIESSPENRRRRRESLQVLKDLVGVIFVGARIEFFDEIGIRIVSRLNFLLGFASLIISKMKSR